VVDAGLTVASGGQLVPTDSVTTSTALTCQGYASELDTLLAQSCGPVISMCQAQSSIDVNDRVGRINIPLAVGPTGTLPASVDIEFPVTVEDSDNQAASTIVKITLTTTEDRLLEWCDSEALSFASSVTSTLYVGTTTDNPLTLTSDLSLDSTQDQFDSVSLMDGLLTLVFDEISGATLLLEEAITLHVNGDNTADAVLDALESYPFTVANGALVASSEVSALCPQNPVSFLNSCAMRTDVTDGNPAASAYKLGAGNTGARDAFMEAVSGSTGAFAKDLGGTLETTVTAAHVGGTAYYINPGYNWAGSGTTGTSVFALSSEVILVALYSVEVGGSRRRAMLQTQRSPSSVSGAAVRFSVSPESLVASVLGLPEGFVVSWKIVLQIDAQDACGPAEALMTKSRSRLLRLLADDSIDVQELYITSVRVDTGNTDCASRRSMGAATAELDVVMAVNDDAKSHAAVHTALQSSPDVVSAERAAGGGELSGPNTNADANKTDAPAAGEAESGASGASVVIIALAVGAACLLLAVGALVWARLRRSEGATHVTALSTENVTMDMDKIQIECKLMEGDQFPSQFESPLAAARALAPALDSGSPIGQASSPLRATSSATRPLLNEGV